MHPHSYLAVQQFEQDRRRDLEQGLRVAQARALARRSQNPGWRRALHSARRLVMQPAA